MCVSVGVMRKFVFLQFLFILFLLVSVSKVHAAQFSEAYLRLDRMSASTATGGTVCAKWATAAGTDAKLNVTFPSGFTVNSTASNWTVTTTNLPDSASAMPGINTASAVAGQVVTFPISDIASTTTLYCFNFAASSTLTTDTAGSDKTGTIQSATSGDVEIDTAGYATAVISNDQVTVTATVPSTFSLALGTNTQSLGTLSTGSVTSGSGVSVTIGTNAGNGWIGWVKSANAALNSTATGDSIATAGTVNGSPNTLSTGTEGYVLDADLTTDSATSGTGAVTIDAEYLGADTSSGGTLSTSFQEFATADGPTDEDVITLIPRATISGLTAAASDYTDILTIVAAGHF
ncbi:MAG: hypothetical protein QG639_92 [Patescibacteria group bacterium]|nr:hypothetical protein [Patescibacteria group bacterium]